MGHREAIESDMSATTSGSSVRACRIPAIAVALLAMATALPGYAAEDCGRVFVGQGQFGPYDYNNRSHLTAELAIVEDHHFTPYMEEVSLYGFSSTKAHTIEEQRFEQNVLYPDLDYTLRAWPNHHRALNAMAMYQLRLRRQPGYVAHKTDATMLSAECYFERAIGFTPNDGVVYLGYGVMLQRSGKLDEAANRYMQAIELIPNSPEPHYNLGLILFERRKYQDAAREASTAYRLGYPLDGLKRKLQGVGIKIDVAEPAGSP